MVYEIDHCESVEAEYGDENDDDSEWEYGASLVVASCPEFLCASVGFEEGPGSSDEDERHGEHEEERAVDHARRRH